MSVPGLAHLSVVASMVTGLLASVASAQVTFVEVTQERGLSTEPTWKYGGPAVADLNQDGRYDFLFSNHDKVPAQLFWATEGVGYREHSAPIMRWDVHGIAAGDYDLDGDQDLVVSLGGGNGSSPQPPRILKNNQGEFEDITVGSGIEHMGARGRSVRWIDLDLDGDLDLLQINAMMLPGEKGPRNILFENLGKDQFRYRSAPAFEALDAEKVLVTDFNSDHISDLVVFSPLGFWAGDGDFGFEEVTDQWLQSSETPRDFVMAAAEIDFDNDGDLDYYLARGKTYYQIANNAVSFDAERQQLDLRDEGNRGHDGITFFADGDVQLNHFFHWQRGVNITLPVYLGQKAVPLDTPGGENRATIIRESAQGFPEVMERNGWYLGYLGNGRWRMEWRLNGDLAWDLRASVHGVRAIEPDWRPQDLGETDLLLRNDGDTFNDVSHLLPEQTADNNWGVTAGDFDSDGFEDLFVYRFGELRERKLDLLLHNQRGQGFNLQLDHGATVLPQTGHGDMGAAFDYDLDGDVDLLSGDDDQGRWHLYENRLPRMSEKAARAYLLVNVGYSPGGTDAIGAEVTLTYQQGGKNHKRFKRVGAGSATHSQSQLNTLHFGLGQNLQPVDVMVRWRDGTERSYLGVVPNRLLSTGRPASTL